MSKKATAVKKDVKVTETLLQMLKAPVITEKSSLGSAHNHVTFNVPLDACKCAIRKAVEGIFKVKVVKVNTLNRQGKTKIFKGRKAFRSDSKKAVVTLAEGQTIDVTTKI